MKRRVRKIVNFFAFNLLFFALYLNFVHKDNVTLSVNADQPQQLPAAFSGTVPAETPGTVSEKKAQATHSEISTVKEDQDEVAALKLSIN